jgi:hypothetical protein
VKRARIGDDEQPDYSVRSRAVQGHGGRALDPPACSCRRLRARSEIIELGARGEAKQLPQFGPAEMPLPELIER